MSSVSSVLAYPETHRAPSSTAGTRGGDNSSNNSYISIEDEDENENVVDIEISTSNTTDIVNDGIQPNIDVATCYNDDYYNPTSTANSVATTAKSDIATICSGSIANENVFSSNMEDDEGEDEDIIVPINDNVTAEPELNDMGPLVSNNKNSSYGNYNESVASDVADVDNDDIHSIPSTSTINITATNTGENTTDKITSTNSNNPNNNNNGRTSPGGTVYKGRGTRRYQGRYMNLPLKRFHHNNNFLHLNATNYSSDHYEQHNYNHDSSVNEKPIRSRSRSRSPAGPRHYDYHSYRNGNKNHYHSRGRGGGSNDNSTRKEYSNHSHSKNNSYYSNHHYYQQHHNSHHQYRQNTSNSANPRNNSNTKSNSVEKNHVK